MSHRELYDQLFAGKPNAVENTIAAWKSAERQADTLAGAIDRDLDRVVAGWEGAAGDEFRDRVGKISAYSRELSSDFLATHTGLSQMNAALAEAQKQAETPEEHDDHDKLVSGALDGAGKGAILGPAGALGGAVIGGIFGHNKDEEEKERARQRMAQLVAGVAAQYELADRGDWRPFTPPPTGLPQGDPNLTSNPSAGPKSNQPGLIRGTGPGGGERKGGIDEPTHAAPQPDLTGGPEATPGDGTVPDGTQLGSQLTGSGDGALAAGATAVGAAGALSQLHGLPSGGGGPTGTGLTAGSVPAGGVLGQGGAAAKGAGAAPKAATTAATARGASASNRADGAKAVAGSGKPPVKTVTSVVTQAATPGARGAQRAEDEADEHSTWLTEDELVWRDSSEVPPPVLGGA